MLARAEVPAGPMVPHRYRVRWRRQETPDTWTVALGPVDGSLRPFRPGQFNMLYAFGIGEVPISVSGDPGDQSLLVHTIRAVGPVTEALCGAEPGTMLGLRGPFGTDWRLEEAEGTDLVIVAGGIGLAPLRPVVYRVLAERGRFERVSLLVGARSPDLLLFREELDAWRETLDVDVAVDRGDPVWAGHVGVVTELILDAPFDPDRAMAMVCGPEVMMRFTARALLERGLRPGRIRISMERNMKCAIGHCGHCQFGPEFVCKDGPVFPYERVERLLAIREV